MYIKILLLLLLLLPIDCFSQSSKGGRISPQKFHKLVVSCDSAIILDARPSEKFKSKKHIRGAISIPTISTIASAVAGVEKSNVILLYCGKELRTPKAAQELRRLGYSNVYELKGGLIRSKRVDLPLEY